MREPGPDDDLVIETTDLEMNSKLLLHAERSPLSAGSERRRRAGTRDSAARRGDVEIARGPEDRQRRLAGNLPRRAAAVASGHRQPASGRRATGKAERYEQGLAALPLGDASKPPVEVTCTGPFHFDFIKYVAGFDENVEVWQVNPEGPADQLSCDRLDLCFARKQDAHAAAAGRGPRSIEPAAGGRPLARAGSDHRRRLSGGDHVAVARRGSPRSARAAPVAAAEGGDRRRRRCVDRLRSERAAGAADSVSRSGRRRGHEDRHVPREWSRHAELHTRPEETGPGVPCRVAGVGRAGPAQRPAGADGGRAAAADA